MIQIIYLIILLLHFTLSKRLVFVIQVSRHGARQPIYLDPDPDLTRIGKIQQYLLGREIRQRYIEKHQLLPMNYEPLKIKIITSNRKRTIESGEWQLSGIYPSYENGERIKFYNEEKEYPPFQISDLSLPEGQIIVKGSMAFQNIEDMLFNGFNACAYAVKQIKKYFKNQEIIDLQENYRHVWEEAVIILNKEFNQDFNPYKPKVPRFFGILDFYTSTMQNDMVPPSFSEELIKDIKVVVQRYIVNIWFGSDQVRRIGVSQMLKEFKAILNQKFIEKNYRNDHIDIRPDIDLKQIKYLMLVGHEFNLILLMLNLLTEQQYLNLGELGWHFPFSSNIFFEVWQESQNSYYVKMKYNDQDIPILKCKLVQDHKCNLINFINLLEEIILDDFDEICKNDNQFNNL